MQLPLLCNSLLIRRANVANHRQIWWSQSCSESAVNPLPARQIQRSGSHGDVVARVPAAPGHVSTLL